MNTTYSIKSYVGGSNKFIIRYTPLGDIETLVGLRCPIRQPKDEEYFLFEWAFSQQSEVRDLITVVSMCEIEEFLDLLAEQESNTGGILDIRLRTQLTTFLAQEI